MILYNNIDLIFLKLNDQKISVFFIGKKNFQSPIKRKTIQSKWKLVLKFKNIRTGTGACDATI